MQYARVRDNKIKSIGFHNFPGSLPVVVNWVVPAEYPFSFYSESAITYDITGDAVLENKTFTLLSVEEVKKVIYAAQKQERKDSQPSFVMYKGVSFDISTDKKRNGIMILIPSDKNIKACDGCWLPLIGAEIAELQTMIESAIQPAWDIEFLANNAVAACDTHDELKGYKSELV